METALSIETSRPSQTAIDWFEIIPEEIIHLIFRNFIYILVKPPAGLINENAFNNIKIGVNTLRSLRATCLRFRFTVDKIFPVFIKIDNIDTYVQMCIKTKIFPKKLKISTESVIKPLPVNEHWNSFCEYLERLDLTGFTMPDYERLNFNIPYLRLNRVDLTNLNFGDRVKKLCLENCSLKGFDLPINLTDLKLRNCEDIDSQSLAHNSIKHIKLNHTNKTYNSEPIYKDLHHSVLISNVTDKITTTPLIMAIENGRIDLVRKFIESGADINRPNSLGFTPLIVALLNYAQLASLLIERGASVNQKNALSDWCPLKYYLYARDCSATFIRYLIKKGCDVETVLHSIMLEHFLCLKNTFNPHTAGLNPLICQDDSVIATLLEHSANRKEYVQIYFYYSFGMNNKNTIPNIFFNFGLDINMPMRILRLNCNWLYYYITLFSGTCFKINAITHALERGININYIPEPESEENIICQSSSCIEYATKNGNYLLLETFLKCGGNPNIWIGCPPIYHSVRYDDYAQTQLLLKYGADVNIVSSGVYFMDETFFSKTSFRVTVFYSPCHLLSLIRSLNIFELVLQSLSSIDNHYLLFSNWTRTRETFKIRLVLDKFKDKKQTFEEMKNDAKIIIENELFFNSIEPLDSMLLVSMIERIVNYTENKIFLAYLNKSHFKTDIYLCMKIKNVGLWKWKLMGHLDPAIMLITTARNIKSKVIKNFSKWENDSQKKLDEYMSKIGELHRSKLEIAEDNFNIFSVEKKYGDEYKSSKRWPFFFQ